MSTPSTMSSTLWAHLLRKDKPMAPTLTTSTPIAPLDKTGTSVRLLLHDTQSTLEKFSERVDNLIKGVEDTRRQVLDNRRGWAEDIEQSTEHIVGEAVNRCKTSLQEAIGVPTQASQLSEFRQIFIDHVDRLHTNIDTIRVLSQTQSQALQTIQDQQGQILTALLPLLPLLQAVPLHIDSAKNDLKDAVRNATRESNDTAVLLAQKRKSPSYVDTGSSPRHSTLKRARLGFDRVNKQLPSPSRSRKAEENSTSSANPSVASRIRTPAPAGLRINTPPMLSSIHKQPPKSLKVASEPHLRQQRLKTPVNQISTGHTSNQTSAGDVLNRTCSSSRSINTKSVHSLPVPPDQYQSATLSISNAHQPSPLAFVNRPASNYQQHPSILSDTGGLPISATPSRSLQIRVVGTCAPRTPHSSQAISAPDRVTPSKHSVNLPSVKDFSTKHGKRFIPIDDEDEEEEDDY